MDNKHPRGIINNTPPELWGLAAKSASSFENLPERTDFCVFIYGDAHDNQYESYCSRNKNGTITVVVKAIDRG